jgi:hypothetical protein
LPEQLLVRASYCNVNLAPGDWTAWANDLDRWASGQDTVPAEYLAENPDDADGKTFKRVSGQLASEFRAVADVRNAFGVNGTLPNTIDQVINLLNGQALHDIDKYTPTAAEAKTSFNLWRLLIPTLKILGRLPDAGALVPVADLMELGQVFLESDGAAGEEPEGINQPVTTGELKSQALAQLSDAQLAIGPLLDRLLTDPPKLLRVAQNLAGINLNGDGKGFTTPNANDIYAANWVQNDVDVGTDVTAMVQGLNQELALNWTSAYYAAWELPTADRHGSGNHGPQQRSPSDTWKLNCNYEDSYGRQEWHVFAKNPAAANNNGQWPDGASYVPLDQSTPTAIWTLVQKQTGDNPWQLYYKSSGGAINKDRHVAPVDPGLVDLLTKPTSSGGYGITPAHLFTDGIQTVNQLPPMGVNDFYVSNDCGY